MKYTHTHRKLISTFFARNRGEDESNHHSLILLLFEIETVRFVTVIPLVSVSTMVAAILGITRHNLLLVVILVTLKSEY